MKLFSLLFLSLLLSVGFVHAQSILGPTQINASDTTGKPLPFVIDDNLSGLGFPEKTTYGRMMRLIRNHTHFYDIGIDASNDFLLRREIQQI